MKIDLLPHQWDFLQDRHKYLLLLAGIGSGKTFVGSHYVLNQANSFPKAKGFISAATYRQLHNSTLEAVFAEFNRIGVPYSYNQGKGILDVLGAKIYCYSLDNPEPLRGIEIGWGWLDEIALSEDNAFNIVAGRLRDKYGPLELRLTTTPKGFNWLFDYFEGEKKTKDFHIIKASSRANTYLPAGYIDSLTLQYDEKMLRQELEAEWLDLTSGAVYYAFDSSINVSSVKFDPSRGPLWVGMDFNISPMTAVIAQIQNDVIWVFDEIYLTNSNTTFMARELIKRGYQDARICPDATGKAMKTSATAGSDHEILRQHGFKIEKVANPYRLDRFNCVNGLLEKRRIIIDNNCKMLIKDLGRLTHDNKDETLSHISDALGYLAWFTFPIRPRQTLKVSHY